MRDSFVFYRSFVDALRQMDEKDFKETVLAICDYALDGIDPELTGSGSIAFPLIKPQIDANTKRYKNGIKGGRPQNQNKTKTKPKRNQTITKTEPNNNQNETKTKPNVNVNDNENENVNVNDSNIPPTPLPGEWDWNKHDNLANVEHLLKSGEYNNADYIQRHEALYEYIKVWMQYKDSKKPRSSNHYANGMSISALLDKFVTNCENYGERAVIDVVNDSLAAGYQGIVWDKVKPNTRSGTTGKIDWSMV